MAKRKDLLNIPMTIEWSEKPNRKHLLRHFIEENNFTSMAEIGVRDGRTTFYLLDKIPSLTIYGVDLNNNGYYSNNIRKKYGDRLIAIEGNSHFVSNQVPEVDIVFIDADHSYNGCRNDIILYKPKVKKGGILSGHDIDFPGVNRAVNELIGNFDVGPNNVWFVKI